MRTNGKIEDIYKVIYELQQRNDIIPMFKLKRQKTNTTALSLSLIRKF